MPEQQQQQQQQRWLPLEGTPEVLGPYLVALGGPQAPPAESGAPEGAPQGAPRGRPQGGPQGAPLLQVEDLVALEPWALDMLECTDTVALLLLFPLSESAAAEEELLPQQLQQQQQQHEQQMQQELWFVKQTVPNACATVALLHCTANLPRSKFPLPEEGLLHKFFQDTWPLDAAGRGQVLESHEGLARLHLLQQQQGATAAAAAADTNMHFTCLLPFKGFVAELDGRKPKPLLRAQIAPGQSFAQAAIEAIKEQFVKPRGEELKFAVLAIGDTRSRRP